MLDIVIPVYGRFDLLEKCLDSIPLACQRHEYKIYVVDDNSPDGIPHTKNFLKNYPGVVAMFNTKNSGFPYTVNKGAKEGKNKYIFLLNSDIVLSPGSLDIMLDRMEAEDNLGVLGMKLLFPPDTSPEDQLIRPPGKVQHVGISFDIHMEPYHIFVGWSENNPKVNSINSVPAVTGAAFLTRRTLWKTLRGMDSVFGRGTFEDVDFCFKVRSIKYYVAVEIRAVATHYVGGSSVSSAQQRPFPLAENKQIFYNRWQGQIHWSDSILL